MVCPVQVNQAYLPPLVEIIVCCELTDLQRRLYNFFVQSKTINGVAKGRDRGKASLELIKQLQKTCGAATFFLSFLAYLE